MISRGMLWFEMIASTAAKLKHMILEWENTEWKEHREIEWPCISLNDKIRS